MKICLWNFFRPKKKFVRSFKFSKIFIIKLWFFANLGTIKFILLKAQMKPIAVGTLNAHDMFAWNQTTVNENGQTAQHTIVHFLILNFLTYQIHLIYKSKKNMIILTLDNNKNTLIFDFKWQFPNFVGFTRFFFSTKKYSLIFCSNKIYWKMF